MKITIINYGLSNLLSVQRAFEYIGCQTEFADSTQQIDNANVLVLPGVGAFKDGMAGLNGLNLSNVIRQKVQRGTPIMGICLGMQMLFTESDEFGLHKGLDLIPGRIEKIKDTAIDGTGLKIPHINWSPLLPQNNSSFTSIMQSTAPGQEAYFVHSYAAVTENKYILANTQYGGNIITAAVQNRNVFGTQFHPEKSGKTGIGILQEYVKAAQILTR